ncbi:MAG TPA: 8-amino-7-oxononanoate synthase [Arachidicoccus sp.]
MQTEIEKYLFRRLEERIIAGNKRQLFLRENGIDFFSNDYLGIAKRNLNQSTEMQAALGSTGSRLLSGNSEVTMDLENFLADFHQTESALLFNSGYDANLGLIAAIANRHTIILYDELSHASIIDAIRLSFCKQNFRFKHNDSKDLEKKLIKHSQDNLPIIVVVESVYSMEGDIAPLKDIAALCEKYGAALIVDEAHATGVFGDKGEGVVQQLSLQKSVFARVHTFGKALGCHGAVVVGSNVLTDYLINFARSFIYTTALPPHAIDVIRKSYQFIQNNLAERETLHFNIQYFNQQKKSIGNFCWKESLSSIQSLIVGNNELTRLTADHCKGEKINVSSILSPTVAKGGECIRICLHSFNTTEEIDLLFNAIKSCLEK